MEPVDRPRPGPHGVPAVLDMYHRLPAEVRRCIRPLNLIDECPSGLPPRARAAATTATETIRRVLRLGRTRYVLRRLEGRARHGGTSLACVLAVDDLSARFWT